MSFFNPADKKHTRLYNYCKTNIKNQFEAEKIFRKVPETILIRDSNKQYKIVTNIYYKYHMSEDEYDTETELADEEFEEEEMKIKLKYANANYEPYRRASLKYKNANIEVVRANNKISQQKRRQRIKESIICP